MEITKNEGEQQPVEVTSGLKQGLGAGMSFKEALKLLNIEDYSERIFHSNSHGELFHLYDYVQIASFLKDKDSGWFRGWFEGVVKMAEEHWQRPESVFQHIPQLLKESASA